MARMKPWYQVVTPREDLRENRPLDASEFAVHLDHIREGRAPEDYKDPRRFFARTHFTTSLIDLASQVLRRLSGIQVETSAVFNMATQFGGGKTHALAALYHLAKHGDDAKLWRGVDGILTKAGISSVPKASVAAFVGTEFDPLTGRGEDGDPVRRTPWGENAWQLGGASSFAVVEQHDRQNVAPGGDVIRKMLPAGPSLILMDELLNFVSRGRERGVRAPLFDFMQNLSETARAQDSRLVICVSIPKSLVTEMTPEDQEDYTRLKNMLDRLGKAVLMSADTEMAEIIRRRLFEWEGLPTDANATIQAYADWVADNKDALVGLSPETAAAQFRSCYPFHPALLSVFERKWQSLPRFQRTRGVLRLLALWVSWAWREEQRKATRSPLIELGSAPLEDPQFRAALFEQMGTNDLEDPLTADIAGRPDSHAIRLDRQATDETKRLGLHQKAATIILFESNGGQLRTEAAIGEIKAAIGRPEANLAMVDPVLEGLVDSCYYLAADRNRYRVSLTPQLNKVIAERKAGVSEKAIDDRVRKIQVKPGEIVAFTAEAADQYGQPFPVADVEWTACGGSVDRAGRFVAGADGGYFTVHAVAGAIEASADVRVVVVGSDPVLPPAAPGVLRWSGTVPPQKWMNFYTKVVSRFASAPGLKLTVAFEVPVAPDQTKSKTDETKTALRELGLSDDVS